jgi:hypothetical protein
MQAIDFPPTLLIGGFIAGAFGAAATAVFHYPSCAASTESGPEKSEFLYMLRTGIYSGLTARTPNSLNWCHDNVMVLPTTEN